MAYDQGSWGWLVNAGGAWRLQQHATADSSGSAVYELDIPRRAVLQSVSVALSARAGEHAQLPSGRPTVTVVRAQATENVSVAGRSVPDRASSVETYEGAHTVFVADGDLPDGQWAGDCIYQVILTGEHGDGAKVGLTVVGVTAAFMGGER